jgi:hypothetical protein
LTDSDIVDKVKSMHTKIEREEEKEEINEEKKITHIASYDNLFKYLEDSEDFNDKNLNILLNLKGKLDFIKSVKSVQTDLTNFVINTFAYKYNHMEAFCALTKKREKKLVH